MASIRTAQTSKLFRRCHQFLLSCVGAQSLIGESNGVRLFHTKVFQRRCSTGGWTPSIQTWLWHTKRIVALYAVISLVVLTFFLNVHTGLLSSQSSISMKIQVCSV